MTSLKTDRFHLSLKSSNKKTGPISVTTNPKNSCSPVCPFLINGGCYAMSGPLNLHWQALSDKKRGVPFKDHIKALESLPVGQKVRLCQAGDLAHNNGKISRTYVRKITKALANKKAWTYTHHDLLKGENASLVKFANNNGLTVNISTESETKADQLIKSGFKVAMACNSDEPRTSWKTAENNRVLVCPAVTDKTATVNCGNCMLCHERPNKLIIAFPAHGSIKKANNAIEVSKNG